MATLFVDKIDPQSGTTLSLGSSGDTLQATTGAINNIGIGMADQWRLTADTNSGTNDVISTNWERNDDTNYSSLGTGLTESSGVFSFPQTGLYSITGTFNITMASGDNSSNVFFQYYINNVANDAALISLGIENKINTGTAGFIFNVTDISTHKFRFLTGSFSTGTLVNGRTNDNFSFFTAIRLGDSV